MPNVLKLGDKLINFASEAKFLDDFQDLVNGWPSLGDITDSKSLLEALSDGGTKFKSPGVRAAFDTVGLKDKHEAAIKYLDRLLGPLSAAGMSPAAKLANLLYRLEYQDDEIDSDDDPGLVKWKPIDLVATGAPAPFSFEISAGASLEFEAGDRWPYAQDSLVDPSLKRLLRIGANGEAKADASAKLPFPLGSLSVGLASDGRARLDYYFQPAGNPFFGIAVAKSLPGLPSPIDFEDIWDAFQQSDLKGIDFILDGAFKFNGAVDFAYRGRIDGLATLGASVGVRAKITKASRLNISMRSEAAPGAGVRPVILKVSRGSDRYSALGVNLAVDVSEIDLALKISKFVSAALDKLDSRVDSIRPFFSPGTWLQEQAAGQLTAAATKLISNDEVRTALIQDMRFALGIEASSGGVADWLEEQIAGAIESKANLARFQADGAIDKILTALAKQIPFGSAIIQDPDLEREIKSLLEHYQNELKAKTQQIFDTVGSKLEFYLNEFKGLSVSAITNLDTALAGVRELFDRYDAIVAQIRAKADLASKLTIQAGLDFTESNVASREFLLAGTFSANTEQSAKAFKTLLGGDAQEIEALFEGANSSIPGFQLDRDNSWLLKRRAWESRSSYKVVAFGFEIGGYSLLSSDASVKLWGNSEIEVNAKALIEKEQKRTDGSQLLRATTVLVPPAFGTTRSLALSFTLDRLEKDLNKGELEDLLDNLVRVNLLRRTSVDRAINLLGEWGLERGSDRKTKVPARVRLALSIDGEAMRTFLRLGRQPTGRLSDDERIAIVRVALAELDQSGSWPANKMARDAGYPLQALKSTKYKDLTDAPSILYRFATTKNLEWPGGWPDNDFEPAINWVGGDKKGRLQAGAVMQFIYAIEAMRDAQFAIPTVSSNPGPGEWTERDYRNAFRTIARGFADWVVQGRRIGKLSDDLRPSLVAFLGLVTSLADLEASLPLSLGLVKGPDADGVVYLLN